jgi:PAS domain S-box-containing protein
MVEVKQHYDVLFQNMAQGAFFQDKSGSLIDVNPAALEMFGLTREQFIGRTSLHPEWRVVKEDGSELSPDQHPSMVALRTGKKVSGCKVGVYNPLYKCFTWLNVNAIPLFRENEDTPYQVFLTMHDISAEILLKKSEEKFRALFEQAGGYCMILDPNTADGIPLIVDANEAACQMHGYAKGEFVGRPVADIDDEEGKRLCLENTREIMTGQPFYVENVHIRKDGTPFHVAVNAQRIDIGDDPPLIFTTEYDITERLNLEAQLRQKSKMEAVGVMAGGMAHNFNNNLSIILGNLELSKLKLPPQSEVGEFLDNAKIATVRSRDLVKQVMTYSRTEDPLQEPLQLSLLLEETISLLNSTIPTSVELQKLVSPDCAQGFIQADASQIQECLLNLCNNAVHAMNEKGELILRLERVELEQKDIPARYDCSPGAYLCLSVQDSGSGIPAEIQEKIFDPFFTTKALHEGTGMGLSTVQGIVEQHHGMIIVESGSEKKTSFCLCFPVVEPIQKEALAANGTVLQGGGERILVVDDDEMIADLHEQMLSEMGYQVTIETDSVEALRLFSANVDGYDLVMTDQTMPELTGVELIQKIKMLRSEIPTILCTGYSSKVDEESARYAGISAFMMKPVDLPELLQTIRRVLDES